jgi:electron transport complex protein RnfG
VSEPVFQIERPPEPSGLRLVGTLTLAGLVSGTAIVGVYEVTLPMIEANNARALERAVFKVTPGSARMLGLVVDEAGVRAVGEGETPDVYASYDDAGALVGYAIPGEGAGFQDTIRLIYGYDPGGGRIVGMEVLESRETPGLGDKIYKDEAFVGAFSALEVSPGIVCVKAGEASAPNEVDAITGATISSKAVVSIIRGANERWLGRLPGREGAPPAPVPAPSGDGGAEP